MTTHPKHLADDVVEEVRHAYGDSVTAGADGGPVSYPAGEATTIGELKNDLTYLVEAMTGHRPTTRVIHDVVTGVRYASAPGPVFPTTAMTKARPTAARVVEVVETVEVRGKLTRRVLARIPVSDAADVSTRVIDVALTDGGVVSAAPARRLYSHTLDPHPITVGDDLAGHVVAGAELKVVDPAELTAKKPRKRSSKK